MENKPFDTLDFLLLHLGRAHHNLMRRQMHTLGLCRGQPPVLFALNVKDGRSNSDLAEFLDITPATLTNKVKRMEKTGLVVRRRDEDDERVSRIYMTEKGRNLMTELKHALAEIEVAMLEGFNDSEVDRLKADIHKILDNIENYQSSIE
jgi:DNA-binding MarR family transcriptional regulator